MAHTMTSKERVLAALALEQPDRVPIAMRGMEPLQHLWSDRFERAVVLRDRFGIDDFLVVHYPWVHRRVVEEKREWRTYGERGEYPLLVTEYHTPAGTLRNQVFMTEDYHVEGINLEADQLMPRMVERTIKDRGDVERLRYLLAEPRECDLRAWSENISRTVSFGRTEGFPVGFYIPSVSGIAMKNVGPTEIAIRAMDDDPMVKELLGVLTDWAMAWLDYGARFRPDIIYFSGVYESTDFWSPRLFGELFAPMHKRLAERALSISSGDTEPNVTPQ